MNTQDYLTKMDKTKLSVVDLHTNDKEATKFWLSKTPTERFIALELLRQQVYGYNPLTDRLQRVFEVAQQK